MNSGNCEKISSRLTFQACKMKKQALSYFSLILILSVCTGRINAQSPQQASTTGHVFAEVVAGFSAVETSQMNFGRFSPGPYGGQIIITPQGSLSVMGSVVKGSGIHNAASFYVTGDSYTSFSINLPKSPTMLTNTTNAKIMLVSDWVSVPSPGPGGGTLEDGFQTVYIGATLEVGMLSNNPVGIYTGTYTITFDFN